MSQTDELIMWAMQEKSTERHIKIANAAFNMLDRQREHLEKELKKIKIEMGLQLATLVAWLIVGIKILLLP
jgi:hypothetical protein